MWARTVNSILPFHNKWGWMPAHQFSNTRWKSSYMILLTINLNCCLTLNVLFHWDCTQLVIALSNWMNYYLSAYWIVRTVMVPNTLRSYSVQQRVLHFHIRMPTNHNWMHFHYFLVGNLHKNKLKHRWVLIHIPKMDAFLDILPIVYNPFKNWNLGMTAPLARNLLEHNVYKQMSYRGIVLKVTTLTLALWLVVSSM